MTAVIRPAVTVDVCNRVAIARHIDGHAQLVATSPDGHSNAELAREMLAALVNLVDKRRKQQQLGAVITRRL